MIKKVKKDNVVKELDNESLVADYIAAGWTVEKVKETENINNKKDLK